MLELGSRDLAKTDWAGFECSGLRRLPFRDRHVPVIDFYVCPGVLRLWEGLRSPGMRTEFLCEVFRCSLGTHLNFGFFDG